MDERPAIVGQPSATVTVKVFPIGIPGSVVYTVAVAGAADLTQEETATLLEGAARSLRERDDED